MAMGVASPALAAPAADSPAVGDNHLDRLPEPLLLLILSKVEAARPLLRCASVCQRFNKLVWQVPRLTFNPDEIGSTMFPLTRCTARNDSLITKTVMQMSSLQSLTIGGSPVAPLSAACLHAWAMHSRQYLQSLTVEAAVRNGLPEVTIQNMACCKNLRYLHLRWQSHPEDVDPLGLLPFFPKFCHLKTLILEQMILSDQFVETLILHCPVLETIALDAVSGLDSPVLKGSHLLSIRVGKWALVSEILSGLPMSSVTIDAPVTELDVRDASALCVPRGNLRSLRILAHSQVALDIKDPSKLEKLVIEAPPRLDVLSGNVRWDLRALQDLLKSCSSLQELELTRVWFYHRGVRRDLRPGDLAVSLEDLIGPMPDLHRLSIGPRILDSLWHAFCHSTDMGAAMEDAGLGSSVPSGQVLGSALVPFQTLAVQASLATIGTSPSGKGMAVQREFPSLRKLAVQMDRLTLEGGLCLAALLAACPHCTDLHIDAGGILEPQVEGSNDPAFFATILSLQRRYPSVQISLHLPRGMLDFRSL